MALFEKHTSSQNIHTNTLVCKVIIAYTHASVVLGISLLYYYNYDIIK